MPAGLVNGGVYLFRTSVFEGLGLPAAFSLEKDFLEKYSATLRFTGVAGNGYFVDIGVPEDYERAQRECIRLETA